MSLSFKEVDQTLSSLKGQGILTESISDGFLVNKHKGSPAFLISVLIHGNEIIGYALLKKILSRLDKETPPFGILIGNRQSYLENKRFIEKDLNRSFAQSKHHLKEELRAHEIEKFSTLFPFILDIHQTSAESESYFYISKYGPGALNLITQLNCEQLPIVISPINFISKEGSTFSQFCVENKIPMATIEIGQKGFSHKGLEFAFMLYQRLFSIRLSELKESFDQEMEVFMMKETIKKVTEDDKLMTGLKNLAPVAAGAVLATVDGKEWKSPITGFTLFPKYGEYQKFSKDLCQILEKKKIKDVTPHLESRQ